MDNFRKIEQIVSLLILERERVLTEREQTDLDKWLEEDVNNKVLYDSLKDETNILAKFKALSGFDKDEAYSKFAVKAKSSRVRKFYIGILKYAAIIIPFVFAAWLLWQNNKSVSEPQLVQTEIAPGKSKAVLKLADGTTIDLEEIKEQIAKLDGTTINNSEKEVVYSRTTKKIKPRKIEYNTIHIPRGGEYQVVLSDGTKVWLNSETSIRYPVVFASDKREVFLQDGEAFFEVAENKDHPFFVRTTKMDVNVLGTSFNVRAYSDEDQLTTTLVAGKITIKEPNTETLYNLLPSDQALFSKSGVDVKKVNVDKYIAWKNGRILFEDNTLDEIFKDLNRWYDIDVKFENNEIGKLRFSVDVERYDDLNKVLDILELTKKVKFKINDNTLIISE